MAKDYLSTHLGYTGKTLKKNIWFGILAALFLLPILFIQRMVQVWVHGDQTNAIFTADELWEEINAPEVEYKEDGSVWVHYLGKSMDITDKFKNGISYVQLTVGSGTKYMTIKYQNGYAMSPHSYIRPWTFY